MPVLAALNSLTREQMVRILTEPKNALVRQYQRLMRYDDVDLEFLPEALDAAADKALERGIGARGLRAVLEGVLTQIMYDVPSDPTISRVIITRESVTNGAQPELVHGRERIDRPRAGERAARDSAS